jgi:hypothetical protein
MEMDDPFDYKKPEWLVLYEREKRRAARSKRLGRPIGTWGGKREKTGRPRTRDYTNIVKINITKVQELILIDIGNGDLNVGIERLINEHI